MRRSRICCAELSDLPCCIWRRWRGLSRFGGIVDVCDSDSDFVAPASIMNVFEIDSCAGGKGTRRKHQTTLENIQPGRAPVGLRPDETLSSNTNAAELESNSECSDDLQEDTLQTLAASSRPQPPRSISYEILQVFYFSYTVNPANHPPSHHLPI